MKIPFLPAGKKEAGKKEAGKKESGKKEAGNMANPDQKPAARNKKPEGAVKEPAAPVREPEGAAAADPAASAEADTFLTEKEPEVPATYREWMVCFVYMRSRPVTDAFLDRLGQGSCPGVEQVMTGFLERLQDTVNSMLQRAVTHCTRSLNTCLEEGDYSNLETILGRSRREMQRCRFYREISFLPRDFVRELDRQTLSEMNRFWSELQKALTGMAEETGSSDLYDILYYVDRLIKKDRQNGQL